MTRDSIRNYPIVIDVCLIKIVIATRGILQQFQKCPTTIGLLDHRLQLTYMRVHRLQT